MAIFSLQFGKVQTFVTKRISSYLSQQLKADISIESIYLKPFSSLSLKKLSLKDKNGEQLLYTESIEANLVLNQLFNKKIIIEELKLTDAYVNYQTYPDSSNFKFLIDYFATSDKTAKNNNKKMIIDLKKIELDNNHFKYVNHRYKSKTSGINFSDIELTGLSGILKNIKSDTLGYDFTMEKLRFKDKSGFHLKQLSARSSISNKAIELDQLTLATNRSIIRHYVLMEYSKFSDFSDFVKLVKINTSLKNSYIDSKDIEYFAPDMKYVRFKTAIVTANASGTVSDINARDMHLKMGNSTDIHANISIKGLPNINSTHFNADFQTLSSTVNEIEKIVPELGNLKHFKLPAQLHKFNAIHYHGTFNGLYNDFQLNGNLKSDLGDFILSSHLKLAPQLTYDGHLYSKAFQLGKLIENNDFSTTGLDFNFKGVNIDIDNLKLNAEGALFTSYIKNYAYDSISFNGDISDKNISINGSILDKYLKVDYKTAIDFRKTEANYKIDAHLLYANLNKLNLFQKDSIVIKNTNFSTNITGTNLNNLVGDFAAQHINLESSRGVFEINHINLSTTGYEHKRQINLDSDVAKISVNGIIDLSTIRPYFESLAVRYAPAIGLALRPYNNQNFNLNVEIKSFKPISAFFDPSLSLADGASLTANFSSEEYKAEFTAFSPKVTYKGLSINNLLLKEQADDKALSLSLLADKINLTDSAYINKIAINTVLANDSLQFGIQLSENKSANQLKLNGDIHFAYNKPAYIHFNSSEIRINNDLWYLNKNAQLKVSKGKLFLKDLLLSHQKQQVKIDGILSNENDHVDIEFNQFGLSSLNGITNPIGIALAGEMNGILSINSTFKNPFFSANINTSSIRFNQVPIGKLGLVANFDPQTNLANLDLDLADELNRGIAVTGSYNVKANQDAINLKAKLKEVDLLLLQPFIKDLVSDLQGKTNADLTIRGNYNNLRFSGAAQIPYASFTINYLKTKYRIENQNTLIDNNALLLTNFRFKDIDNHDAQANGIVNLQKLTDPLIDVQLHANNFQIMNTSYKDNNLYYGTVYSTGQFSFQGPTSAMDIAIKAKSNNKTVIHIPFNSAMTITDNDFIYFVKSGKENQNDLMNKKLSFRGLTMNMDLELTPEAEVNLATNLGSLKGNGSGEVSLKISSLGDFEMFGDYSIHSGKFHFTAQDFINKYFDIKRGGTIRWTGNPSEAIINMIAMYQQRTSVSPLYNAAGRSGNEQRVLAQADMVIKGTISQPDVTFGLNFPQDPYIVDELQGFLSDANNVNQQALSLIMRRSFTPSSTTEIGREVNSTLLSAGTEIAFNQLNSIISQSLNINFFDLNIRSLNDASASFRFFNDRLVFTGGITDRSTLRLNDLSVFSNRVATDAELMFNIRRDGSLRFRAYNRLNTRNFLNPYDDYISAAGLVYRQEFNTFNEFWKTLWWRKRKNNK